MHDQYITAYIDALALADKVTKALAHVGVLSQEVLRLCQASLIAVYPLLSHDAYGIIAHRVVEKADIVHARTICLQLVL